MKEFVFILSLFITALSVNGQNDKEENYREKSFYDATNKWFSAWELVSKDIYNIKKVQPVDFIFFDDKYVYSTSNTTVHKGGTHIKGCNLSNLKLGWQKAQHNDSIVLPDKSVIPVGLMSFARAKGSKPFFVMPLPGFWKLAGVDSKELGLDNLITGIFIHEFSHSQQMQNFGRKITEFEKQYQFEVEFSDDIVQNIFRKDSAYLKYYNQEVELFYNSLLNESLDKKAVDQGFEIMKERQKKYFNGKYESLSILDNFFLTMEGLGQYSMYLWLIHPRGGNISKDVAVKGVRRGGKWWSQDEGFALFLVLDKLAAPKNWAKDMFGKKTESVIHLIEKYLAE